jgi:hypothetical protein
MSPRYLAPSVLIQSAEVSPARYLAPALMPIPTPLRTISCAPRASYLAPAYIPALVILRPGMLVIFRPSA